MTKEEDISIREFVWNTNKHVIENGWIYNLEYVLVILQTLNDSLKEKESTIGWWIILITSFNSFLTLFDLEQLGTDKYFNTNYAWAKSVTLSVLSITTTLLASWTKKKGFIKRIKDIDKRTFAIEALLCKIWAEIKLPVNNRLEYVTFYKTYISEVQEMLPINQLISPMELNIVTYELTKNYPSLILDTWPWYKETDEGISIPDIEYGRNIIRSYEKKQLNNIWYRWCCACFYCKSRCCKTIDDGNPFTRRHTRDVILDNKMTINNIGKRNKTRELSQNRDNLNNMTNITITQTDLESVVSEAIILDNSNNEVRVIVNQDNSGV